MLSWQDLQWPGGHYNPRMFQWALGRTVPLASAPLPVKPMSASLIHPHKGDGIGAKHMIRVSPT